MGIDAAGPADAGAGACYLTFDVANLGMLSYHWSKTPIEGALAEIRPGRPVAAHKFTQRAGRSEIIRNIREDYRRLFQGWAEFIKSARQCDGTFVLLEPREVTVTFSLGGTIEPVDTGVEYLVNKYSAVAVCGKDRNPYTNVRRMSNAQFMDMGLGAKNSFSLGL
jgi:hypothetical protein